MKILIVEDDPIFQMAIKEQLTKYGDVLIAPNFVEAQKIILQEKLDILITDLTLNDEKNGIDVLDFAKNYNIYSVVMSGSDLDDNVEKAYSLGCKDFFTKERFKNNLDFVINKFLVYKNQEKFRKKFLKEYVTTDDALLTKIFKIAEQISSDISILLTGPTGTGKTYLAKLIHAFHHKNDKNFIHINCAQIPENLLESELFGHIKGSFTGAISNKIGKLELANNGTLFLDEITCLSSALQAKLLTALEEKKFYPIGSNIAIKSNFKLISATCSDIFELMNKNLFRVDLFHRIQGMNLDIPPLTKRYQDIPLLLMHFFQEEGRQVVLKDDAIAFLQNYSWPGNIRELKKVAKLLSYESSGIITKNEVQKFIQKEDKKIFDIKLPYEFYQYAQNEGLNSLLEKIEKEIIIKAYKEESSHARNTMKKLNISSSLLYKYVKKD